MNPGGHIEYIRQKLDDFIDEHPLEASGHMGYCDVIDGLHKMEQSYNRTEVNKLTQNEE